MSDMKVTTLYDEGVTTVEINEAPADVLQDIWSALKRGDYTVTFDK